jgi:hypothetical protein
MAPALSAAPDVPPDRNFVADHFECAGRHFHPV